MIKKLIEARRDSLKLNSLALRDYLDKPFTKEASDYFLRRLRESENLLKVAIRQIIENYRSKEVSK